MKEFAAAAFVTATVILLLGIVGYIFLLGRIEPIPRAKGITREWPLR
jgi:preprotein translocase subunit Sss1